MEKKNTKTLVFFFKKAEISYSISNKLPGVVILLKLVIIFFLNFLNNDRADIVLEIENENTMCVIFDYK